MMIRPSVLSQAATRHWETNRASLPQEEGEARQDRVSLAGAIRETTAAVALAQPLSKQEVARGVTLRAVIRRLGDELSPRIQAQLRDNPDLAGVLCGTMPSCSLPLPADTAEQDSQQWGNLALAQSLASGQLLETLPDPHHPGHLLLLNKYGLGCDVLEVRWGLRLVPESWTEVAAEKAEKLNVRGRDRARQCQQLLQSPPLARSPESLTPTQVGMISYVDSEEQLERFSRVLEEWKSNLVEFGHHHVHFHLCDDSPEPFGSQIRELLQACQKDCPIHFRYLGSHQKAEIRERLDARLREHMEPAEAARVSGLLAGAGATQNRNLSLQLLGPQGGLQMDHDMTPEILTTASPKPIPYDMLTALERASQHSISSFRFSGSNDVSIDTILARPLPELSRKAWQALENRDPREPYRVNSTLGASLGNAVRGPMYLPTGLPQAARIAPGLRDGDLALTTVCDKLAGYGTQGLAQYVHHRDDAGSRWGGAELLMQYLLYEKVDSMMVAGMPGKAGEGPTNPKEAGEALLKSLQTQEGQASVADSACFKRCQTAVPKYLAQRRQAMADIDRQLERLGGSQGLAVVEQWRGKPAQLQDLFRTRQELTELRGHLEQDLSSMQERLCIGPEDQIEAERLDVSLLLQARQVIKTQALALIHENLLQQVLSAF